MSRNKCLPAFFAESWRSSNQIIKRHLGTWTAFRAALVISLLGGLALSITSSPTLTTTAQERRSTLSEASSLSEAQAAGVTEQRVSTAQIVDAAEVPDGGGGGSCSWTNSTVYPRAILDQATVALGTNIYTFGGVSTAIIADANRFDGTTWTAIAPLPAALEFPAAVTDGTNIYVLGGALVGSGTPQTTLYRYNVAANNYTTLAPFTTGTWNHAAVYLNGKIYKFAGTGPGTASTNAMEIYDVAGNSWTAGAPYPLAISFVTTFLQGNFIYAAGGIQSVGSVASLKTYRYDPAANAWDDAAIADMPQTRWGPASSQVGFGNTNSWVLAGGYVNGSLTANISPTVIRWNPSCNVWTSMPNMLGERARVTGAILGGNFYVIGGRSLASSGFVGTNSNQRLSCVSGVLISSLPTTIVSETCGTPNGAPDPGETLTISLPLQNTGDVPTTNLTATLQASGGVTNPSSAQNYGALLPGCTGATREFTFRVDPELACGAVVTLTFVINDGGTPYPNVVRTLTTGVLIPTLTQNFDSVTPPALPAGWTTVQLVGTAINWVTTTTTPNSPPNTAFANDPTGANLSALISPPTAIQTAGAQLSFRNNYLTETNFDGMVLEFTTNGGANWTDIIVGGGSFVSGGYNGTLAVGDMNPLPGRMAWTGNSGGYITTLINLPAALNGQTVQFRWLMGSDAIVAGTGVRVDDVQIFGQRMCNMCVVIPQKTVADFDGDGRTDLSVFRPSDNVWYILNSSTGTLRAQQYGLSTDKLVPGDYDGDEKTDIAVFRNGDWFVYQSTNGITLQRHFGASGDVPAAADYDGDGKTDFAVFRPSTGVWYIERSSDFMIIIQPFGVSGDLPVAADYSGDGRADIAVWRPSNGTWYTSLSAATNYGAFHFGMNGDRPVQGDYDGDGRADRAVFRPSQGIWYILGSSTGSHVIQFGVSTDVLVPGDYDADDKTDVAVFRPLDGVWHIRQSSNPGGRAPDPTIPTLSGQWGQIGDKPVPAAYVPEQ